MTHHRNLALLLAGCTESRILGTSTYFVPAHLLTSPVGLAVFVLARFDARYRRGRGIGTGCCELSIEVNIQERVYLTYS
jgi:hypothetical protein